MPQIYTGMAHAIDRYIVEKCFKFYHSEHEVEPINVPILGEGLVAVEDPEIGGAIRVMLEYAAAIEDPDEQEGFILGSLRESYENMLKTGEWTYICPIESLSAYGYAGLQASRHN